MSSSCAERRAAQFAAVNRLPAESNSAFVFRMVFSVGFLYVSPPGMYFSICSLFPRTTSLPILCLSVVFVLICAASSACAHNQSLSVSMYWMSLWRLGWNETYSILFTFF